MQQTTINQINNSIKYFRLKMLIHDCVEFAQSTAWMAALCIAAMLGMARLFPIPNLNHYLIFIGLVWLATILLYTIKVPKSSFSVAWRIDQDMGLKERVSSAINFSQLLDTPDSYTNLLVQKQRIDTIAIIKSLPAKTGFQITWSTKKLLAAFALIILASLLIILPNPMDDIIQLRESTAETAEQQAEKIEELAAELEEENQLSPEEKEYLIQELGKLVEQLRQNEGNLSEALADITNLEQKLLEKINPNLNVKSTYLEHITSQLTELAGKTQDKPELDADLSELLKSISNQIPSLDQTTLQDLSQAFQALAAQAAQSADENLAQSLSDISQAILSGNQDQVSRLAEEVANSLSEANRAIKDQQSLEKALAALQESRDTLSQAGIANDRTLNDQQSASQFQNSNPGQNPGNGPGMSQSNSPGGGGGTNADSLPPFSGSGQANDPTGINTSTQTENLGEQIFVPWERLGDANEVLSIPGQDSGQGLTESKESNSNLPGATSPSLIPYTEVFKSYSETAYQTIENSYIPSSLRDYVLQYFSMLEP